MKIKRTDPEEIKKFKKYEQNLENQILALLKISSKQDEFTEEEIEDLLITC